MIKINHLDFSYEDTPVLSDINLTINQGEKVGIIGESGSGKSTFQKILTGELTPQQGHVKVDGNVLPIFQSAILSFNKRLTLQNSLEESLKYYLKLPKDKRINIIKNELPKYHLPEMILMKYPEEVSGGELQRVNILRTLIQNPEIVVCDEVTSNLDVFTEREIIHLLNKEHKRNQNIMMIISHNIAMLSYVVDRILVLYNHKIVDDFNTEDIFSKDRHDYTKELVALFG